MKANRRKPSVNDYMARKSRKAKDWIRSWFFTSDGKFTNFERLNPEE